MATHLYTLQYCASKLRIFTGKHLIMHTQSLSDFAKVVQPSDTNSWAIAAKSNFSVLSW